MFWRVRSVIVASALLGVLVSGPGSAAAAEWHPPVEGGIMLLGFGIPYPGGTHRGVDIAAESGAEVASPAAGTISFAGQVPADGGGTCTAITLELADGRKMSLLPPRELMWLPARVSRRGRSWACWHRRAMTLLPLRTCM